MTDRTATERTLTGRHVAMIFGGGFSIIIAVNVALAVNAVRTFPGLEVKNSYIASQSFDADRRAQEALGWTARATYGAGALVLEIDGPDGPVLPDITKAVLGRPTHVGDDHSPVFETTGTGLVAAVPPLDAGYWSLRIEAVAEDGTLFKQRLSLRVPG
jgi:nitrogen fixation protein FixH